MTLPRVQILVGDALERLREIPGFPGYAASADGVIWSRRVLGRGQDGRLRSQLADVWQPLTPSIVNGYPHVAPCVNGRNRKVAVHRLVLLAWVGPPPTGCEGCHENGDRIDARLVNLRWDTRPANHEDKRRHGTTAAGERNPGAKLSDAQVVEIRTRRRAGERACDLARVFGVHPVHISNITRGARRAHSEVL